VEFQSPALQLVGADNQVHMWMIPVRVQH
jgi:hypothetical protein